MTKYSACGSILVSWPYPCHTVLLVALLLLYLSSSSLGPCPYTCTSVPSSRALSHSYSCSVSFCFVIRLWVILIHVLYPSAPSFRSESFLYVMHPSAPCPPALIHSYTNTAPSPPALSHSYTCPVSFCSLSSLRVLLGPPHRIREQTMWEIRILQDFLNNSYYPLCVRTQISSQK